MIAKNRAQLKAWIKNMSYKVEVNENIILQNYMLERLLERISVSEYKYKFILKGGMLITAIVGIDMRNTLDMDATIKGFDLEKDNLEVVDTITAENAPQGYDEAIYYLSESIEFISKVDVVYFMKGWEEARGCKIENKICQDYGKQTMYDIYEED